jgi:hypothetical protein
MSLFCQEMTMIPAWGLNSGRGPPAPGPAEKAAGHFAGCIGVLAPICMSWFACMLGGPLPRGLPCLSSDSQLPHAHASYLGRPCATSFVIHTIVFPHFGCLLLYGLKANFNFALFFYPVVDSCYLKAKSKLNKKYKKKHLENIKRRYYP